MLLSENEISDELEKARGIFCYFFFNPYTNNTYTQTYPIERIFFFFKFDWGNFEKKVLDFVFIRDRLRSNLLGVCVCVYVLLGGGGGWFILMPLFVIIQLEKMLHEKSKRRKSGTKKKLNSVRPINIHKLNNGKYSAQFSFSFGLCFSFSEKLNSVSKIHYNF